MEKKYTLEMEKIEELLKECLPDVLDSTWYSQVFPNLNLKPYMAETVLEPVRDLFKRGGKRWRPLLAHLICRVLGGGDAVLPLLPLIEFCHNASLIHDDIEDNSDQRRGKPAIHLLYGNDTAINSGSFLYFLPLTVLENWKGEAEDRNRLWYLWAKYMRFLHLGQSIDIAWHRDPSFIPSMEDYMVMCSLKTGCLSRYAAILGAEAAKIALKTSSDDSVKLLSRDFTISLGDAAQKLGVGFQILDDVKNLTTGIKGKKRGDDVVEGKKSLPVLLFMQDDTKKAERAALVQRCFSAARKGGIAVPEIEEFITALTQAGILEEAKKRGKALIAEAKDVFSSLQEKNLPKADSEAIQLLVEFTELLQ